MASALLGMPVGRSVFVTTSAAMDKRIDSALVRGSNPPLHETTRSAGVVVRVQSAVASGVAPILRLRVESKFSPLFHGLAHFYGRAADTATTVATRCGGAFGAVFPVPSLAISPHFAPF